MNAIEILPYGPTQDITSAQRPVDKCEGVGRVPSGAKFAPDPLISEGYQGDLVIADLAFRAPIRSREQAQLFYKQGIRETRLVNARRWRDVQAQHAVEEIVRAEKMCSSLDLIRKQDSFIKELKREERKAASNPHRLESLDAQIRSLRPDVEAGQELITSASERELALVKVLQQLKKLDRQARGWKLKAQRQIACGLFGMQYDAEKCGRAYFRAFHCRNRYCPVCGPHVHHRLLAKYLDLQEPVADFLAAHASYRLRILDITAIKRGEHMPSPEDVRRFKADVKKLIATVNRRVAEKLGQPQSKKLTGYLYCLEYGFDNNNLHCHGVLVSPFIEQDWLSDQWRKIRNDGSFRVFIAEATSFDAAIKHALEYTGKYAAPSAERAFELEMSFAGCRRVDGLGWFFNRLPKDDFEADLRCPCGDPECFLKPNRDLGWQPLAYFKERAIPDLGEVQRGSPPSEQKDRVSWVN